MSQHEADAVVLDPGREGRTGDIAWRSWGEGDGVPVVLLHGVTDDSECWAPLAPAWATGRRVVAVDARGHGGTPLGPGTFTISALAADAADVVCAELRGGPAVVVGHSMGGIAAEQLALADPGRVAALVLEDPSWREGREIDALGIPVHVAEGIRQNSTRTLDDLLDLAEIWHPGWPADELGPWARSKLRVDPRLAQVRHEWDPKDWVEVLARVHVPVTLVRGDARLGGAVNEGQVTRARELLGDALTDVPLPCGHNVRREARGVVVTAVQAALDAADAARRH